MNSVFKPNRIRRQSLPELVAEAIQARILSGELKDGDVLVQETIAAAFDVSRMPVREAFRQLEAAGLIRRAAGRGAVVTAVPVEQIAELFDIRAALEPQLLRLAVPMMTEAVLDLSRSVLAELESAYRRSDVARWGGLNWDFHESLYRPSGRLQTLAILKGIHLQIDRFIRLQLVLTHDFEEAEEDHRALLRLAETGDVERAAARLESHVVTAKDNLLSAIARGTPKPR